MSSRNYRNIAYRPERERHRLERSAWKLFAGFCRLYLFPHKWLVLLAAFLVSMNACSVYLMAWYSKVVIDEILVMQADSSGTGNDAADKFLLAGKKRSPGHLPEEGMLSERVMKIKLSERTPGAMKKLGVMFLLYSLTIVALNFSARLAERNRIEVARAMAGRLRNDMHKKIMLLSRAYHQRHTPGQLMSRVMSDVNVVQNQMAALTVDAISHVVTLCVGFGILLAIDRTAALLCLLAVPPYSLIYIRIRRRLKEFNREMRHTNACMYAYCAQKLDSVKAVLCYARDLHERLNFFKLSSCYLRDAVHQQRLSAAMNRSAGILATFVTVSVFLIGCNKVLNGTRTIGEMMYAYGTAANIFVPVLGLATLTTMFNNVMVILQRIMQVLEEPLDMKDPVDAVDFPAPVKKGISLKNVTFSFSADADPVVRNVTVDIPAGQWLCVMGASGAGKSALLGLIGRLYDPVAGEITVDGVPLKKIKLDSLRNHVAMVPQEAEILGATVRDNIAYGLSEVEPTMIMDAAKAADVHDFIMSLPVKYETLVGEKGARLSGGQRQRISLARALITSPDVLLLDDCTSALDADTERKIQNTLAETLKDKTAVIVSQRISMAMRCHKICVITDGAISEMGSHEELLKLNGFYSRMYSQQT